MNLIIVVTYNGKNLVEKNWFKAVLNYIETQRLYFQCSYHIMHQFTNKKKSYLQPSIIFLSYTLFYFFTN